MSQSVAALSSSARVVIVGVRDYDKPWAQSAEGALHDAIAWWHYAVRRLGVHPHNIRLLTSPRLGALDLVEAVSKPDDALRADLLLLARATPRARATGAHISESIDWLMDWEGQKLLTFSGHGVAAEALLAGAKGTKADLSQFLFAGADHVRATRREYAAYFAGDGLVELIGVSPLARLAASAAKGLVAGDGPEQAPPPGRDNPVQSGPRDEAGAPVISRALPSWASELRSELGERLGGLVAEIPGAPAPALDPKLGEDPLWTGDLTVVIDACFATPVAADATMADRADGALAKAIGLAGRGLLSCDVNHTCYTVDLNGRPQGAWSWALQTVLSRWQTQDSGLGQVYATLTHDELHVRARALLDTLGIDQRPLIAGVREVDQSCLMGPLADDARRTSNLAALAPDFRPNESQFIPIPFNTRWVLEVGSASSPLGPITYLPVGYMFNPNINVSTSNQDYFAGTEYWRSSSASWAAAQELWASPNRHKQQLRMRLLDALDVNSAALKDWLKVTFEVLPEQFDSAVATTYGSGSTNADVALGGFQMLGVFAAGGGLANRGVQIVFGGASGYTMKGQRWFWRAASPPSANNGANSGYFAGPYNVPVGGALVFEKVASIIPAPMGTAWYTHISVAS